MPKSWDIHKFASSTRTLESFRQIMTFIDLDFFCDQKLLQGKQFLQRSLNTKSTSFTWIIVNVYWMRLSWVIIIDWIEEIDSPRPA